MKKLSISIEQKAKAYDEALKKAKDMLSYKEVRREDMEYLFPELKESEDERIRKEIIRYLKVTSPAMGENIEKMLAWLEKQGEPQDKGEISDGYHTFNELYYYRMLYNAAFFNLLPKEWVHKSKRHHDGEECFGGGWFIVMANLPTGQISNHYELNDWDLFQIPEKEIADEWDNHTPQQAAERLHRYLLEKQGFQKPTDNEMKEALRTEYEKGRADAIAKMQNPTWSEEDEEFLRRAINATKDAYPMTAKWLKSLKGRVQPKQEWSKEDESIALGIEQIVNCASLLNVAPDRLNKVRDWLKSLKQRIGG